MDVVATDEFEEWFDQLDERDTEAVSRLVGLLEAKGVALGYPYSSSIMGSRQGLRELRSRGKPLRVFYAFDPKRDAVLLIGGDKTGDKNFYERMVPQAERIWIAYLEEQGHRTPDRRR